MECAVLDELKAEDFTSNEAYEKTRFLFYQIWLQKEGYRKQAFGVKSERFIPENPLQLLFDGLTKEEEKLLKVQIQPHQRKVSKKKHPGRNILPGHLPRNVTVIIPDEVKANEEAFVKIGEESSERLEMTPANFWVEKTVRPKYKRIEDQKIICANLDRLFPHLLAGYSVISYILTSKYADHIPLYRIVQQFARGKVNISDATMVGWISYACVYLETLYSRMLTKVPQASIIHADETVMPVVEEGKEHTHRGYMYVYVVDKKHVIYDYRHGRGAEGPVEFLKGFSGVLQTDGYAGYNAAVSKYNLTHIACMAHIRRKFFVASEKGEKISEEALEIIRKLYEIEEEIKTSDETEILRTRREKSLPILEHLKSWGLEKQKTNLPQSETGKAITYFFNEYENMRRYIDNPLADIDNNLCERTVRPMTIGRKNYLFAGNDAAAKRAAIIYSLVLTCRSCGRDPYAYFVKVFETMQNEPEIDLDLLLPDKLPL